MARRSRHRRAGVAGAGAGVATGGLVALASGATAVVVVAGVGVVDRDPLAALPPAGQLLVPRTAGALRLPAAAPRRSGPSPLAVASGRAVAPSTTVRVATALERAVTAAAAPSGLGRSVAGFESLVGRGRSGLSGSTTGVVAAGRRPFTTTVSTATTSAGVGQRVPGPVVRLLPELAEKPEGRTRGRMGGRTALLRPGSTAGLPSGDAEPVEGQSRKHGRATPSSAGAAPTFGASGDGDVRTQVTTRNERAAARAERAQQRAAARGERAQARAVRRAERAALRAEHAHVRAAVRAERASARAAIRAERAHTRAATRAQRHAERAQHRRHGADRHDAGVGAPARRVVRGGRHRAPSAARAPQHRRVTGTGRHARGHSPR